MDLALVTLTTDFGTRDPYVAAMKGVILGLCPRVTLVDITHEVAPFDVAEGAYLVGAASGDFPAGAIHVAVVDPGVGSDRKAVVVETDRAFFLAPDNGLLSAVLSRETVRGVNEIRNPNLMLPRVGATFHGRDVFAPAAAHLARGTARDLFGPPLRDLLRLSWWNVERDGLSVRGAVVHVDRFGNAVTDLRRDDLGEAVDRVLVKGLELPRLHRTYADVAPGMPVALIGSQETLEISVNGGSAARELNLSRGDIVEVLRGQPGDQAAGRGRRPSRGRS